MTESTIQQQNTIETQVTTPPKKSKKVLLIVSICLILFFGLIGIISFITINATKEPLKASNDFLTAFTSQDSQTVYNLTSDKFQTSVTLQDFTTFHSQYKEMGLDQAKIVGRNIKATSSATIATLTYTLEYESEIWEIETEMIEQDGQWMLYSISIK